MKIVAKKLKLKTNLSKEKCPACGKNLRKKAPCCGSPEGYLFCMCGYKEVVNA